MFGCSLRNDHHVAMETIASIAVSLLGGFVLMLASQEYCEISHSSFVSVFVCGLCRSRHALCLKFNATCDGAWVGYAVDVSLAGFLSLSVFFRPDSILFPLSFPTAIIVFICSALLGLPLPHVCVAFCLAFLLSLVQIRRSPFASSPGLHVCSLRLHHSLPWGCVEAARRLGPVVSVLW